MNNALYKEITVRIIDVMLFFAECVYDKSYILFIHIQLMIWNKSGIIFNRLENIRKLYLKSFLLLQSSYVKYGLQIINLELQQINSI